MSKFQRSWLLFKASVSIVARHRKLLVFPVVTLLLTAVVLGFFLVPIALQRTGYGFGQPEHWTAVGRSVFSGTSGSIDATPGGADANGYQASFQLKPLGVLYCAAAYFLSMFLATFFNVAFYHEILAALKGDAVSVGRGLSFAASRWKPILAWTLLAGIVGMIIQRLEEKFGIFGRWILGYLGMAWSVACIFVVPVLVMEERPMNPFELLKKSASTLRQTWGESLVGYLGLRFGGLLVVMGSVVLLGATGAVCAASGNWWPMGVVAPLWLAGLFLVAYVTSVASHVYRCALYLYSTEGTIPAPYDMEMLQMAWKTKKG